MSSSYRNTLNTWLSQLEVKADTVLDIGGAQESLQKRVKSWDVNKFLIGDLPNPHRDSPKPDIEINLNHHWTRLKAQDVVDEFDMIFCLEVFEYVWNPVEAMRNIRRLLKEGGTAWVTFPSFYPHHQPIADDSLRYMEGGIKNLAKAGGLTIMEVIKRRPETNALQQFFSLERMRAAKDFDHNVTGYIVRFTK